MTENNHSEHKKIDFNLKIDHDLLKKIIKIAVVFLAAVLIFGAGVFVGQMKAKFSYGWAENYHRNFGGPRGGFIGDWRNRPLPPPEDFVGGHGIFGPIIKIDGSTLTINGKNGVETVVLVSDQTGIRSPQGVLKIGDLKVDDQITVIGLPNSQGQIEAKLIRVFR
jgi:hypothetical protein